MSGNINFIRFKNVNYVGIFYKYNNYNITECKAYYMWFWVETCLWILITIFVFGAYG